MKNDETRPRHAVEFIARRATKLSGTTECGIDVRQGANLPHWTREGAIYAVTFRLADSLPSEAVTRFARERDEARSISDPEQRRERLMSIRAQEEAELDRGSGACPLARPEARAIVTGALRHFDGVRYALFAYAVMPNHVHAILRPLSPHTRGEILHSWKSFAAHQLRAGRLWQSESYDHLVRDDRDLAAQIEYVRSNPVRAGLQGGVEVWVAPDVETLRLPDLGNASDATQVGGFLHRRDADATGRA